MNESLTKPRFSGLDVNTSDPDDARRRKLLDIILTGTIVLSLVILLATFIFKQTNFYPISSAEYLFIYISGGILLLASIGIFFLNRSRKVPGWVSSTIFLILSMVILAFTDTPQELANGRSLFVFTIPIIISSVLLKPASSFVFSILSAIEIIILAMIAQIEPNTIAIIGFFMIALVSWLSSRSLEQALGELRNINVNLDRLVIEKTQELAKALSRELVLAGRNQAILESIADGVIVFDPSGEATQANPAISELLEIPSDHIIGTSIQNLVETPALKIQDRNLFSVLLTDPEGDLTNLRIQWGEKTLSVVSSPVHDSIGDFVGTVAVFRDFTREAEVEKMKDSFLAIVSHELRTPLNAIIGFAEMLKESIYGPVNEKQSRASERILNNSQRLLSLVNDLLDQARMEAGKLSINLRPLKPFELIENVYSTMEKIASKKGLEFSFDLDPALPETFYGDNQRLQQILVNLITNAIKFTDVGSINAKICRADANHWRIEVTDTGRGIPENELEHIFEAFRQVEATSVREHGGFGLGLSIVKQLVTLMNGEINVASHVGSGSTFLVTLPLILPAKEQGELSYE